MRPNSMTDVFIRIEKLGHKHTEERTPWMETGIGVNVYKLRDFKDRWQSPEARRQAWDCF